MIDNLNRMKIRKFNEAKRKFLVGRKIGDMEEYDIFTNGGPQQVIYKDLVEDYFSLLENLCVIYIDLCAVSTIAGYEEQVFPGTLFGYGQICWKVSLDIKKQYDFYINGPCWGPDSVDSISSIITELKSINNKLKKHNHTVFIRFEDEDQNECVCYVLNNENGTK